MSVRTYAEETEFLGDNSTPDLGMKWSLLSLIGNYPHDSSQMDTGPFYSINTLNKMLYWRECKQTKTNKKTHLFLVWFIYISNNMNVRTV